VFTGDAGEPGGGVLGSKLTATISIYGDDLTPGRTVELLGGPIEASPEQVAEATQRARAAGYGLAADGGRWFLSRL
jgi:hypothetical protein